MTHADVVALYNRAKIGAKVIVKRQRAALSSYPGVVCAIRPAKATNRIGSNARAHGSQILVPTAFIDIKEAERTRHRLEGEHAGIPQHKAIWAGEPK